MSTDAEFDEMLKEEVLNEESWLPGARPGEPEGAFPAIKAELERFFAHGPDARNHMHLVIPDKVRIPMSLWDLDLRYLRITILWKTTRDRDERHEYWAEDLHTADNDQTASTYDVIYGISKNKNLSVLKVNGLRLADGGVGGSLGMELKRNTTLRHFSMTDTYVPGADSIEILARAVEDAFSPQSVSEITKLQVNGLSINHEYTGRFLANVFGGRTKVTTLSLGLMDPIRRGGFDILEGLIAGTTSITHLDLSGSSLGDDGLRHVFNGVKRNSSLLSLKLSDTNPRAGTTAVDGAGSAMHDAFRAHTKLMVFKMKHTLIGKSAFSLMMNGIKESAAPIDTINIYGSIPATADAASEISQLLSVSPYLVTLDISDTAFPGDEAGDYIGRGVRASQSLEKLTIGPDRDSSITRGIIRASGGLPSIPTESFAGMKNMDVRVRDEHGTIQSLREHMV